MLPVDEFSRSAPELKPLKRQSSLGRMVSNLTNKKKSRELPRSVTVPEIPIPVLPLSQGEPGSPRSSTSPRKSTSPKKPTSPRLRGTLKRLPSVKNIRSSIKGEDSDKAFLLKMRRELKSRAEFSPELIEQGFEHLLFQALQEMDSSEKALSYAIEKWKENEYYRNKIKEILNKIKEILPSFEGHSSFKDVSSDVYIVYSVLHYLASHNNFWERYQSITDQSEDETVKKFLLGLFDEATASFLKYTDMEKARSRLQAVQLRQKGTADFLNDFCGNPSKVRSTPEILQILSRVDPIDLIERFKYEKIIVDGARIPIPFLPEGVRRVNSPQYFFNFLKGLFPGKDESKIKELRDSYRLSQIVRRSFSGYSDEVIKNIFTSYLKCSKAIDLDPEVLESCRTLKNKIREIHAVRSSKEIGKLFNRLFKKIECMEFIGLFGNGSWAETALELKEMFQPLIDNVYYILRNEGSDYRFYTKEKKIAAMRRTFQIIDRPPVPHSGMLGYLERVILEFGYEWTLEFKQDGEVDSNTAFTYFKLGPVSEEQSQMIYNIFNKIKTLFNN